MKLISLILLAASLSADAFVIQPTSPSSSATALKDIGLEWGYNERGYKQEYIMEDWTKRNHGKLLHNQWAYNPWSGISQSLPSGGEAAAAIQEEFAFQAMWTKSSQKMKAQAPPAKQATSLPPSKPAKPMPEVGVPAAAQAAKA